MTVRVRPWLGVGTTPMLRLAPAPCLLAGSLSGCASRYDEAPQDAVISTAANALGFLIVGLADENAGSGLILVDMALGVTAE